jgi:hypothetical protein
VLSSPFASVAEGESGFDCRRVGNELEEVGGGEGRDQDMGVGPGSD